MKYNSTKKIVNDLNSCLDHNNHMYFICEIRLSNISYKRNCTQNFNYPFYFTKQLYN